MERRLPACQINLNPYIKMIIVYLSDEAFNLSASSMDSELNKLRVPEWFNL